MQKKKQKNHPLVLNQDDQIIAEFTNYLSITLRNARIKYLKKWTKIRKFECSIEDLELDSEPFNNQMEEQIEEMLAWQMVKNYLPLLTPKECEVIMCLYVNRLTTAETARKLELAAETVRWHKSNALRKIRNAMEGKV